MGWVTKAPMPTARSLLAAGVVNGILYAVGGNPLSTRSVNEAYNPSTNTWTSRANMPTGRQGSAAGVVGSTLYVVGGTGGTNVNQAYNPSTNTWTSRAAMPTARQNLAAGVVNGILYAVGGYTGSARTAVNQAYNPSTNTWASRANMPTARERLAVGVVGSTLYAVGGYTGSARTAVNESYNPSTDTWSTRAAIPTARDYLAVGVVGSSLYTVGGDTGWELIAVNERYDPSTNTWVARDSMPTARSSLAAGVVNGILYVVGGLTQSGQTNVNEVYTPPPPTGTVTGTVRHATTLQPLAGVSVTSDDGQATTTGSNGTYTLANVTAGTRTITFSAAGYNPQAHIITVPEGGTYTLNVDLAPSVINELAGQQIIFVWGDGTDRAERSETGGPVLAQALWTGQDQLETAEPGLVGLLPTSAGVDLVTLAELAGQQAVFVWGDGLDLADRFELGPALLVRSQVTGWVGQFWDEPGLFQLRPALVGTDQLELAEPGLLPLLAGLAGVDRQEMVETGTALLVLVGSGSLDGWFWEELLGRLDLRASLAGQDWREFWEPGLLPLRPALEGTYQLELGEIAGLALLPLSLGGVAQQVMAEPALAWVAVFSLGEDLFDPFILDETAGQLVVPVPTLGLDWAERWEPGQVTGRVLTLGLHSLVERPRAVVVHLGARPVTVLLLEADLVTQLSVTGRPTTTVQLGTDLVTQLSLTDKPTTTVQLVARGR